MFLSVQSVFRPTGTHIQTRVLTAANGMEGQAGSYAAQP
jgi:hypothetical protein